MSSRPTLSNPSDILAKRPGIAWMAFLILLVFFILLKIPTLKIPYFWDELNVYATGSLYMHDHGIGILPAQLDPEYSRGHPLLSYAYTAIFYRIFGDSVLVGHASAIFTAALVLILLFRTAYRTSGPTPALSAVLVLMCQPIFFSMAGVIYPEMLLTLFFVWGIYALATEQWLQFSLAASLAVLVKEPGLILPAAGGVYWLISLLSEKAFSAPQTWKKLAAVLFPVFIYGVFLLIQKAQNGWYFFPYHLEIIHYDLGYMFGCTKRLLSELFMQQGRIIISVPLLISIFFFRRFYTTPIQRRYFLAFSLVLIFTLLFAAVNFYLARYWIFVYPSFILLGVQALWGLTRLFTARWRWPIAVLGMAATVTLAIRYMDGKVFADNYDLSYIHTVRTVQECIDWMQTQPEVLADTPRVTFPLFESLRDPRNGYVKVPIAHRTDWNAPSRFFIMYRFSNEGIPDNLEVSEVKRFVHYDNTIYVFDTQKQQ